MCGNLVHVRLSHSCGLFCLCPTHSPIKDVVQRRDFIQEKNSTYQVLHRYLKRGSAVVLRDWDLVWCVYLCIYILETDFQHTNGNVSMVHCVSAEGSILLRLPCIHTVPLCGKTQTRQQLDASLKASVSISSKCLLSLRWHRDKIKIAFKVFYAHLHINMHKIRCRVVSTMPLINLYMNLN